MSAESYLRNRRLAYGVALAVLLLLTVYLLAGRLPDVYSRPVLLPETNALTILHDAQRGTEQDLVQIALTLDPTTLKPRVLGRYLTGLAAAPMGDRLVLCATRTSSVQIASVPLDTLTPAPNAHLASVPLGFPWPQAVILMWLMAMLFLAITLVYLGSVLLRQRQRYILAALGTPIPAGPKPAGFLARLMALLIDYTLLWPLELFALEALDVVPAAEASLDGPTLGLLACIIGAQILYFIVLEALFGRTLGKRLVGLRVARFDGSRASLLQVVVRNLLRIVDVFFLPTAVVTSLVLMVVTARRQRLGDFLARTVVLEDDPGVTPESPEAVGLRKVLERAVQRAKERERK